jgi:hypothetical protein
MGLRIAVIAESVFIATLFGTDFTIPFQFAKSARFLTVGGVFKRARNFLTHPSDEWFSQVKYMSKWKGLFKRVKLGPAIELGLGLGLGLGLKLGLKS